MSRLIAFEWDNREARVAVASARGSGLSVEQVFAVPLGGGDEAAVDVPAVVGQAIKDRRLGRTPALVALSRGQVELKPLSLPPAPDDELPDMVRLQAMREFTSLGDNWPLDFLPLSDQPQQAREVLAAAVSPEILNRVTGLCQTAGVEPMRVALRPMAAASLFLRSKEAGQYPVRLLIDLSPTEADLTVIVDRRVVFTRTARLGGDVLAGTEEVKPLVGEIRRTLAGVHNQLQSRRVEAVYLLGSSPFHATLAARMQEELNLPCRAVDGLAAVELSRDLKQSTPQGLERYAALIGLLLDEAQEGAPPIDFLNPRKAPPPPSRKKTYILAATAAGFLLLLTGLLVLMRLSYLDGRVKALREETSGHSKDENTVKARDMAINPLEDWMASDYVLLDEIAELSQRMPKSDKVMLTQLSFSSRENVGSVARQAKKPPGKGPAKTGAKDLIGGEIPLHGVAKDTSVISLWRTQHPELNIRASNDDSKHPMYGATFDGALRLAPQSPDYRPAQKPATAKAEGPAARTAAKP